MRRHRIWGRRHHTTGYPLTEQGGLFAAPEQQTEFTQSDRFPGESPRESPRWPTTFAGRAGQHEELPLRLIPNSSGRNSGGDGLSLIGVEDRPDGHGLELQRSQKTVEPTRHLQQLFLWNVKRPDFDDVSQLRQMPWKQSCSVQEPVRNQMLFDGL
jgi:hypothetical protein